MAMGAQHARFLFAGLQSWGLASCHRGVAPGAAEGAADLFKRARGRAAAARGSQGEGAGRVARAHMAACNAARPPGAGGGAARGLSPRGRLPPAAPGGGKLRGLFSGGNRERFIEPPQAGRLCTLGRRRARAVKPFQRSGAKERPPRRTAGFEKRCGFRHLHGRKRGAGRAPRGLQRCSRGRGGYEIRGGPGGPLPSANTPRGLGRPTANGMGLWAAVVCQSKRGSQQRVVEGLSRARGGPRRQAVGPHTLHGRSPFVGCALAAFAGCKNAPRLLWSA
jgi:hypothetical protein